MIDEKIKEIGIEKFYKTAIKKSRYE